MQEEVDLHKQMAINKIHWQGSRDPKSHTAG